MVISLEIYLKGGVSFQNVLFLLYFLEFLKHFPFFYTELG